MLVFRKILRTYLMDGPQGHYIKNFLGRSSIVCSAKFHQKFAKTHSLIIPFFSCETSFDESI